MSPRIDAQAMTSASTTFAPTAPDGLARQARNLERRSLDLITRAAPSCSTSYDSLVARTNLERGRYYGRTLRKRTFGDLVLVYSRHAAGSRLPRHSHEHAYFCVNDGGVYAEEYGRRRRLCRPGTLVFHPAAERHCETHHEPVASLNVEVGGTWLRRFAELGCSLDQPAEFRSNAVAAAGARILREFREADEDSALAIEALTWEILAASSTGSPGDEATKPRWLLEAREALDARLDEPPTLQSLAADAGVHPVHFAAAFRRFYGCSVGEYLRRRRVQLARRRLGETDLPLAAIAAEAGFADQSHMTRMFKRFVGVTPGQYRTFLAFKRA